MKKSEFLEKVYALTKQLNELVDALPDIIAIEEDDDSVLSVASSIMSVELDAENLSDLYFETETETV